MKFKTIHLLYFIILMNIVKPIQSFAQTKTDVITMMNGEKKTGKVISVNESIIKFSYEGETAEYEIKKSDVNEITFSSGRVEKINAPSSTTTNTNTQAPTVTQTVTTNSEQRKNKIAVLPFEIMTNDASLATESMSKQVQLSCLNALRQQSPYQTIQDPMVTNNILAKNNLTVNNLAQKTPQEWAEFLGVEYVIMGSYSIKNKGVSTYGSGSATYSDKTKGDKTKGTAYGSSNTYSSTDYDTRVNVSIYNDNGEQIFTDSRAPAFGGMDSYNSALKASMKRSPFKRK